MDGVKYRFAYMGCWKLSWVLGRWIIWTCTRSYVFRIFYDKPIWSGDEEMKKPLNWTGVKRKVSKTIRGMYKHGSEFVSSYYIAKEIHEKDPFPNATYKATIDRVTAVLKDHMKWKIYANSVKGRVYVVPERWWKSGKSNA